MNNIPINLLSLYSDVLQRRRLEQVAPASISRKRTGSEVHLYASVRQGAKRRQFYLGPEHDAAARSKADAHKKAAAQQGQYKKSVQALKRAGIPGPTVAVGRILAACAADGIFARGAVLIGTLAYQHYPCLVGTFLPEGAAQTEDADLAATRIGLRALNAGNSFLETLKNADPSFVPAPPHRSKLPYRFVSDNGFMVELLATPGRSDDVVLLPALQCSALPMPYLDYLLDDPVEALSLYNGGVVVRVPDPARFVVHKLMVHQLRKDRTKAIKDLVQARALAQALRIHDPDRLRSAIAKAARKGPHWKRLVDKGVKLLDK